MQTQQHLAHKFVQDATITSKSFKLDNGKSFSYKTPNKFFQKNKFIDTSFKALDDHSECSTSTCSSAGNASPLLSPLNEEKTFTQGSLNFRSNKKSTNTTTTTNLQPKNLFPKSEKKKKKQAQREACKIVHTNPEQKFKTELCKNWIETGACNYSTKCRFAHGKHELNQKPISNNKYKSKRCTSFFESSVCPYGSRCLFKHEERKFDDLARSLYSMMLKVPEVREIRKNSRRLAVFENLSDESIEITA